jgi:hypothetical protein
MLTTCHPNQRAPRALAFMLVLALVVGFIALPARTSGRARPVGGNRQTVLTSARPALDAPSQLQAEPYGKVEMSFEPNQGQTDEQVKFLARGAGYTVFLTAAEAVFVLAKQGEAQTKVREAVDPNSSLIAAPTSAVPPAVLRMKLEGANAASEAEGLQKLEGIVNYFRGSDSAKWHAEIPTFARVRYPEIYSGVDLVYYGTQRQLEYDFVVRPGADWRQVSLAFEGADGMEVDRGSGDLLLKLGESTIRQLKPVVYQEVDGKRREVESSYELRGAGRVGFAVGHYDATKPLIIDPVLAYSTYLGGGAGGEGGNGIAVDSSGNAYVTGTTLSVDFPTTANPFQSDQPDGDSFVTKLNAAGSALIYSTYFGGSASDSSFDIAIDASGNAYVSGSTVSTNFPTTPGAFDTNANLGTELFLTKLNATGSALIYSTYLGGSSNENVLDIALDPAGNIYVTGFVISTDFPTTPGAFDTTDNLGTDTFVTKLNATGSALVYSTYLGGDFSETGAGIAVDSAGNAYVTGATESGNFPTTPGAFDTTDNPGEDAFVTKLNVTGSALVYSTYLGGDFTDRGMDIALDSAGNSYVTGLTSSTNFPTQNAFQTDQQTFGDCFVSKLNPTGSALVYSTYLGGSDGNSQGTGIAIDAAGNAYVAGHTTSTDFPTANPFQLDQPNFDVFVTKLDAAGSALVYSTYLGGGGIDFSEDIAIDSLGNAYIAGSTQSVDFPTTGNAFQTNSPGTDAFISKFGDYTISGRVLDSGGNGIAGVTITLSGARSDTTQTDASGSFLFLDTVPGGSFSLAPSKSGFAFNPSSFSISNLNVSVPDILFIGTTTSPTIASLQFSDDSYQVGEGDGSIQIIVTRTGDASSVATVDYATNDGTASDRSDYTTALGRLVFLPGETAKSFNVFVTDDAFTEGNEVLNLVLSNPNNAVLGSPNVAGLTINNDFSNSPANPIDESIFFVRQHYRDFLNREPDPAGLNFWVNNIESCGADQGCREVRRVDTSAAFFLSIEFQQTGFYGLRFYRAAFNRQARFREFIADMQALGKGVIVGQNTWEAQLNLNKVNFSLEFTSRPEFTAAYAGLTNAQYVDALNANTGGALSQSERDALVAGLNNLSKTRTSVLREIVEDADLIARELNPAFVLLQYFGYLRRNPNEPPDADLAGYNFWLQKLNSFAGDYRKAEMVKAFITSIEYRQRFGPP